MLRVPALLARTVRLSLLLLLGALVGGAGVRAALLPPAEPSPTLRAALAAEERQEVGRALELFLAAEREQPGNAFVLQKIAKQYSDSIVETPDRAEKRRLAEQALAYSQRAAEAAPESAVVRLSIAISYGKLALYSDTRTKVDCSRHVKEEAERALALDPHYDWAYHVLGRWHHEAASIGGTARFFARLVYGGIPPASHEEAVRLLRRAVELAPDNLSHRVELGIALAKAGRPEEARSELTAGLALPEREKHDTEAKLRARAALARLEGRASEPAPASE